jgi:hypothetical protein
MHPGHPRHTHRRWRAKVQLGSAWLVDSIDADLLPQIEALGIACRAVPTLMTDHDATAAMAVAAIDLVG